MKKPINVGLVLCMLIFSLVFVACNNLEESPKTKDIVAQPERFEVRISDDIKRWIDFELENKGRLNDTIRLEFDSLISSIYDKKNYQPLWCGKEKWLPLGDSLFSFIGRSKEYGLFPSDYHYRALSGIRKQITDDSVARKNASLWTRGELLLTDAFIEISRDIKRGRLKFDSVTLRTDSVLPNDFYVNVLNRLQYVRNVDSTYHELEPKHPYYDSLKLCLKAWLDSIGTFRRYTYLTYPYTDSAAFFNSLQRRLFEEDVISSLTQPMDTAAWHKAISEYQKAKSLKVSGKVNDAVVSSLNNTDWEKFKRIAITLDRFKLLPDSLPPTYVWVNIPAYSMRIMDDDTLVLESRIIVGQPKTRTPLLTSQISNFVTYPQWTVPESIIFKEMLPAIQKNVDYLAKQNLIVVDRNDSIVDPHKVNWRKFSKRYFPYQLKQREGDDNSLGVLKFNFPNKYDVYLHDTNARWLFNKKDRDLSHGCVRVKDFMKLADFLVRNDTVKYNKDTLRAWIKRQEKHTVYGFKKTPVYIRYYTCEGKNGKLRIYDDIYGEDKILRERYFADKTL